MKDQPTKNYSYSQPGACTYFLVDHSSRRIIVIIDCCLARDGNGINDYSTGSLISKSYLYLNGFVYKNDTVQYTLFEEGRIRYNKDSAKFFYDYFLRDHLGNVRTVLTEEQRTDAYPAATMETSNATIEESFYSNLNTTRVDLPPGYPTDNYYTPNYKTAKTNGNGNKIGPAIILKVMAGDKFNVRVSSWYNKNGSTPQTPNSPLADLITALANSIGGISTKANSTQLSSSGILNPGAVTYYGSHNSADSVTKPKAFLNWVLFDEQFSYVSSSSGFDQVGSDNTLTVLQHNGLSISKNGYLYIYVSNETPNIDVYFDNLQVTHLRGPLLQVEGYYPFGLEMAGISSNALNLGSPNNSYKFNGGDEWEESINFYSTFFRGYDQQLGRFNGVDVLSEKSFDVSPYQFSFNNPLLFNDPTGALSQKQFQDIIKRLENSPNGGYWSSKNPNVLLMYGDQETAEFFGELSLTDGGGGGSIGRSDPLQRISDRISQLTAKGYDVSSITFQFSNHFNGFGIYIDYAIHDGQDVHVGNSWVGLPEVNEAEGQLKNNEDWEAFKKTAGVTIGLSDLVTVKGLEFGLRQASKYAAEFGENPAVYAKATKILKNASRTLGFLSLGIDVIDGATAPNGWDTKNTLAVLADGFSIVCPVFGIFWFLGDMVSEITTGKSLSENLANALRENMNPNWHFNPAFQPY